MKFWRAFRFIQVYKTSSDFALHHFTAEKTPPEGNLAHLGQTDHDPDHLVPHLPL